ncbi:MAG: aldehyde dehydrogenase family protein [Verrucomicrobiota bacterium]
MIAKASKQVPHFQAIRSGVPYSSLDVAEVRDVRTGEILAEVSQVNAGVPRRDLLLSNRGKAKPRTFFNGLTAKELVEKTKQAGEIYLNGEIEIEGYGAQDSQAYIELLSGSTGLPKSLCLLNMEKVYYVLTHVEGVIEGLSRGLDLTIFDNNEIEHLGVPVCIYPEGEELAVILPSNSPGVNALWIPAIAMKVPVILKPGREDPWTPYRLIQSMVQAGIPKEVFSFYPTDHAGSEAIVELSGRSIVFGGDATVKKYASNPNVETHGTGRSKILIGEDLIENWRDYLDVLVKSVAANGGRSCINTSCIVVPKYGDEIAQAIAEAFAKIEAKSLDDPEAGLAGFANPTMAEWIDQSIDEGLETSGAIDLTTKLRGPGTRKVELENMTYLLPTVVRCDSLEHPLGNTEFLFPYVSVVEMPQTQMIDNIGFTLVATAITNDEHWKKELLQTRHIDRLNFGPMPTCIVKWEMPHEGNLFEFLFKRRALMRA